MKTLCMALCVVSNKTIFTISHCPLLFNLALLLNKSEGSIPHSRYKMVLCTGLLGICIYEEVQRKV